MRYQLPLALLLASSAAACVESGSTSDTAAQTTSALEQGNGGFDTVDDAPMFGQEAEFASAAIETDTAVADPMASDPSVTAIANAANVARHRVLLLWGRMPPDPTATTGRNWSGSLTISRGALVVDRRVGFEDATDRLLPRPSRDVVAFQSVTRPFADGLVLTVLDPDSASADPLTLTYASASDPAQTYTLDLAQLATGPISIDAGGGNRVVAAALRDRDACDHGFMRGRWHALRPDLGVYRGVVAGADGNPIGHIRGIYGQRANGDKVMFGKFIDRDGNFKGILVGRYADGEFHARWLDRAGDHGVIDGKYFDAPNLPGGGFVARWAETSCAQ